MVSAPTAIPVIITAVPCCAISFASTLGSSAPTQSVSAVLRSRCPVTATRCQRLMSPRSRARSAISSRPRWFRPGGSRRARGRCRGPRPRRAKCCPRSAGRRRWPSGSGAAVPGAVKSASSSSRITWKRTVSSQCGRSVTARPAAFALAAVGSCAIRRRSTGSSVLAAAKACSLEGYRVPSNRTGRIG